MSANDPKRTLASSRRREFITLLGGAAVAWPLAARAQQPERMRRIGVLVGNAESDGIAQSWLAVFRGALTKLGWTEGRNLRIELRWGAGDARRPPWVLTKEEDMSDDRTKADKAWEARQEAARYRIFNAATNAAEATDAADDEKYFAVLDQAGNAAEAAAAEITGYKTYVDLLEALDTRRKQS